MKNLSAGLLLLICCILAAACSHRNFAVRRNTMLYAQQLPQSNIPQLIQPIERAKTGTCFEHQPGDVTHQKNAPKSKTGQKLKITNNKISNMSGVITTHYVINSISGPKEYVPRSVTIFTQILLAIDLAVSLISLFSGVFISILSVILLVAIFASVYHIKIQKNKGKEWEEADYTMAEALIIAGHAAIALGALVFVEQGSIFGLGILIIISGGIILPIGAIILLIQLLINIQNNKA